ncbi:ABC-F family ATP-binding cassette domain-containing protein [Oculatella sp. FACHB-28]|uniref:ribosomal protection-like ABC-F family protein n=1 Tax=Oculatella sp. FACHB-28 TaxID=2692845 RepID=UPI00168950A5|nr:ABC-F family ATP-binding cassette domain-containing protein [Oculatella sp. FACHB-28]MBD2056039.1 ABC-F family ATP-binding cassette domain-containing protein [Oculatella sp. FACHB-28]
MSNDRQPYLIAENLSYELNSTHLFQGIHLSLSAGDRVALVGSNGVGKSTLLKLLSGEFPLRQGSVVRNGSTYYLPQISTIRESIQSESIFNFLNAISNEWWEIEQILETIFSTTLDLSLLIQNLSGGELTKLLLAVGLARSPNLLFLDEPTNHLDYLSLEELRQFLCQFQGAFVIVSHKPFFLDQVTNTTWELTPEGLQVYGGNYSLYREQKQLEHSARMRSHETARKELKRAKTSALREQERAAQSSRNGRRRQLNGDMPRIAAGGLKRQAEATAATLKVKHDQAIATAVQKVAATKVRTHKTTSIQLEGKSQKHRNLIEINQANLWVDHRLLLKDIQLQVESGDRLSIAGVNGSGKSCFVKAIVGIEAALAQLQGNIRLAQMQIMYLDQSYEFVDRTQTVLENMQRANPALNYQLLRQQLGHFLFFNDDVYKSASVLSGGELARLAIAMITISELDLLILDEPTNNLDITTVDQIVEALNEYQGALWVISHDLDFLSRINITRSFRLQHQTLQQTMYLPSERSHYYNELLECEDFNGDE